MVRSVLMVLFVTTMQQTSSLALSPKKKVFATSTLSTHNTAGLGVATLNNRRGGELFNAKADSNNAMGQEYSSSSIDNNDNVIILMSRRLLANKNLYWILSTTLAVWFLFLHAPKFWQTRRLMSNRDLLLAIHILTAGGVYLSCAHNCFMTPSRFGAISLFCHRWVGRMGLVAGTISFGLGTYLAWSRLDILQQVSSTTTVGTTTLGFAIPITFGGIMQILCQIKGFKAIRTYQALREQEQEEQISSNNMNANNVNTRRQRLETLRQDKQKALGTHIGYMISLFVCACGIPAGIRLAEWLSNDDGGLLGLLVLGLTIGALQLLASRYVGTMIKSSVGGGKRSPKKATKSV